MVSPRSKSVGVAAFAATLLAVMSSACGGSSDTTNGPAANLTNFTGTFNSSNYAPAAWQVGMAASGSGATQSVTGSYSTSNGITGNIQGTLTGSFQSGVFQGTLSYNTSPLGGTNCNGVGTFSGTVATSGIDWTSSGFTSQCPGDPKTVHAVASPGGSGPVATPPAPAASVNVTGIWLSEGEPVLNLTQASNGRVTGNEIFESFPGATVNSSLTGLVTGTTFTGTLTTSFTSSGITCTGFTQTLNAQVSGSTMTGTVTNGGNFSCTSGLTIPIEDAGVPQDFVLKKQ